jgi:hypothetical protein
VSRGVQHDAEDHQDHGESKQGDERFHLELSDPRDTLVNLAVKDHNAKG